MGRAAGTLALGVALVLVARAFSSPSLYVPGVALVLLSALGGGWVIAASARASLSRRTGPATIEEGREWPLELEARTGRIPAPGGELREPLLRGALPMAGRRRRDLRTSVRFERRGRRRLGPARLVISDPLGLIERVVASEGSHEVLVLPRVEPVVTASGRGAGAEDATGARPTEASAATEMDSLRPYREGAPASRIHWATVARTGTLVERRLASDSDTRPLVVLDPRHGATAEALDMAARAAASLCVHLARAGGCALLLPGDRRAIEIGPDLGGWPAAHARLAVVDAAAGAPTLRTDRRRRAVFWVAAGGGGLRSVARLSGERYLVTPGGLGRPAAFTVAGCSGVAVGRAVRSAA